MTNKEVCGCSKQHGKPMWEERSKSSPWLRIALSQIAGHALPLLLFTSFQSPAQSCGLSMATGNLQISNSTTSKEKLQKGIAVWDFFSWQHLGMKGMKRRHARSPGSSPVLDQTLTSKWNMDSPLCPRQNTGLMLHSKIALCSEASWFTAFTWHVPFWATARMRHVHTHVIECVHACFPINSSSSCGDFLVPLKPVKEWHFAIKCCMHFLFKH